MKLSVVIPSFNEEKTIGELIRRVVAEETAKEILIVDDGSADGTWGITQNLKLKTLRASQQNQNLKLKTFRNKTNRGKGYSVRRGMKEATGEVLIIQDADLEYDPADYQRLLKPIFDGKTEVVYGSRLKELKLKIFGKRKTPLPLHYLVNRFLSFMTNILYGSQLTDMETCYKVMTKKVYQNLDLVSNGFEIEPEITAKICKKGFKVMEVPIKTKSRSYQEGKKIKAKDALMAIITLIKYKFVN